MARLCKLMLNMVCETELCSSRARRLRSWTAGQFLDLPGVSGQLLVGFLQFGQQCLPLALARFNLLRDGHVGREDDGYGCR